MGLRFSPLVEYLLAYTKPDSGKLCKLGAVYTIVDAFPPNTTVTYEIGPTYDFTDAFAVIEVFASISPLTPSGAFEVRIYHENLEIVETTAGELAVDGLGFNAWMEITPTSKLKATWANTTDLYQYLEILDYYLVFREKTDWAIMKQIVEKWNMPATEKFAHPGTPFEDR